MAKHTFHILTLPDPLCVGGPPPRLLPVVVSRVWTDGPPRPRAAPWARPGPPVLVPVVLVILKRETRLLVPVSVLSLLTDGVPPTTLLTTPQPRLADTLVAPTRSLRRVGTVKVSALPVTTRHSLLLDRRRNLHLVVLTRLWSSLARQKWFSGARTRLLATFLLGASRPLGRVKNLGIRWQLVFLLIQQVARPLLRWNIITLFTERERFPQLEGRLTPKWWQTLLSAALPLSGVAQITRQPPSLIESLLVRKLLQEWQCRLCFLGLGGIRQTEKPGRVGVLQLEVIHLLIASLVVVVLRLSLVLTRPPQLRKSRLKLESRGGLGKRHRFRPRSGWYLPIQLRIVPKQVARLGAKALLDCRGCWVLRLTVVRP